MGGRAPTAVFGLSVYNGERHLAEAIESLLGQRRGDLAVVVVDDGSQDSSREIALRYREVDPRVTYDRNERRLGLAGSWRRAFELAGERFPSARYFAWASDHDVWHPAWLETLAAELESHPEAVLAYPLAVRIDDFGSEYPTRERPFDTVGIASPTERVRRAGRGLTAAGELIYGLARRTALDRCGPFPIVVLADRLQLLRLAVEGEFRQVERRLWFRRYRTGVVMSNRRQRASSFPEGVPVRAYAPWWLSHALLLARSPGGDRRRIRLAGAVLFDSILHAYERRRRRTQRQRRWRRRERSRRYRGLVRGALGRLGLGEPLQRHMRGGEVGPASPVRELPERDLQPSEALTALERAELLDSLAAAAAVVVVLGESSNELASELETRFPQLVYAHIDDGRTTLSALPRDRIDLAVSIGGLEQLKQDECERIVRRLYELGTPALYSFDREAAAQRVALGRWYWLREVWLPGGGAKAGTSKPDPLTGPVPRKPGRYRHLVGRRRLLPERGSASEPQG